MKTKKEIEPCIHGNLDCPDCYEPIGVKTMKTQTAAHTPNYLPVRVEERQSMGIAHFAILDDSDHVVCRFDFLGDDDGKSRAKYFSLAVNAHQELVEKARKVVDEYFDRELENEWLHEHIGALEDALTKAEGKE